MILPKDAGNFEAYGFVNGYVSVYNDEYARYPSAVMHEIGRNMGFDHSSEGHDKYGDGTGVLGYGKARYNDKNVSTQLKAGIWGGTQTVTK